MLKHAAGNLGVNRMADAALTAPRQVWLAGLGAAIATREWARSDASDAFRALVKEGSTVEARAVRTIRRRIESSLVLATAVWNGARDLAQRAVNEVVESAAAAFPALKASSRVRRAAKPAVKKARMAAKRSAARKSRRGKRSA